MYKLKILKVKNGYSITNGYWQIIHDLTRGGCINDVRIFHGSNQNILINPICSYFAEYAEYDFTYPCFRDDFDNKAKGEIIHQSDDIIKLKTTAELMDKESVGSGVQLEIIYEYHAAYIKIFRKFICRKKITGINQVGIGRIEVIPELNNWTAKESYHKTRNDTSKTHYNIINLPPAQWDTIDDKIYPAFIDWHSNLHMALFNKGVEGIEVFPDSNLNEWENQLITPDNTKCARFAIYKRYNPERIVMYSEPYFGIWEEPLELEGEYKFTSYLAIPNVRKNGPDKKNMWLHNVLRIRKGYRWVKEDEIKELADNGINVLIHHHDTPAGHGIWPDKSFFWPNGKFPPYNPEETLNMQKTIDLAHKYNMKIIPYFNPRVLNAASEVYDNNIENWARQFKDENTMHHHYDHVGGIYGTMACLESGFSDFMKVYIKNIIEKYNFDGAYFDGSNPGYCNNLNHAEHAHTCIDGMIDLIEFTRNLVGEDGVIISHQTMSPLIAIENMIDVSVIMEDINGCGNFFKGTPELKAFPLYCDFVNVAQKAVCAYTALLKNCPEDEIKKMIVRCAVKGLSYKGKSFDPFKDYDYWKNISKYLSKFHLANYRFEDYSKEFIITDVSEVHGAVYCSDNQLIVILGNTESKKTISFSWHINPQKINLHNKITLIDEKGKQQKSGSSSSIKDSLSGFGYKFYIINY